MLTMMYAILATAMLAAGALAQLVPPTFNNTPQVDPDKDGALRLHNFYRGQVGVPALTWCNNLTEEAQVAADWAAGADIPNSPLNFTRRSSSQSASFSMEVVYLSPGTPHVFGTFHQATLAFWAANEYYHGEVIPNGDFFKYSPYSECAPPKHTYHLPGEPVTCMTCLADNHPILKPRWSGTAPPALEWPVP